jgi:Flp pilus assembly protein TadD
MNVIFTAFRISRSGAFGPENPRRISHAQPKSTRAERFVAWCEVARYTLLLTMESGVESNRLRQEIERALRRAFDPADVLPRLARLARLAPPASDDGVFAHRQLAELLVERHPWRAAIYARRALAHASDDDRAWAVLAFCQTLLGNFRCAAKAYQQAIASAPGNPWYAHNLGHLLDVALAAPHRALPWLRSAYDAKADNSEIVASYVHALGRAGKTSEARAILERALQRFDSRELEALLRWLDQGAPSVEVREARAQARRLEAARGKRAAPASSAWSAGSPATTSEARAAGRAARAAGNGGDDEGTEKEKKVRKDGRLARVLERGLSHLPLDARQRERALALARDAVADAEAQAPEVVTATARPAPAAAAPSGSRPARGRTAVLVAERVARPKRKGDDVAGLAAAVAYAIVYVDHVPLSHAEVAAPFRVAVARLRGRFAELRAKLDIIPGDARYATTRGC